MVDDNEMVTGITLSEHDKCTLVCFDSIQFKL